MATMQMNPLGTSSFSFYNGGMGVPVSTSLSTPKWMPGIDFITAAKPAGIFGRPEFEEEFPYRIAYRRRLDAKEEEIKRALIDLSMKYPGERLVLLCWCNLTQVGNWCHRRMLSEWLGERDLDVPELDRITANRKPVAEPPKIEIEPLF